MKFTSFDFCKLTINDASDLLLNNLNEEGEATALLKGISNTDGSVYDLTINLKKKRE